MAEDFGALSWIASNQLMKQYKVSIIVYQIGVDLLLVPVLVLLHQES